MTKLNKGTVRATGSSPLRTSGKPDARTHEGATGFARDSRTQLYLLASTTFAGEGSFYETAERSDARLVELTGEVAREGKAGWEWLTGFLPWLRSDVGIRTSALICAAEAGAAVASAAVHGRHTRRSLLASVQQRADEPGELLAYGLERWGRALPVWLKRGIADGATRLYDERAVLRWDKPGNPVRFADVAELCHPEPKADWQSALFGHLIAERRGRTTDLEGESYQIPETLRALRARAELNALTPAERHTLARRMLRGDGPEEAQAKFDLAVAGQWEWLKSWLGEREGRRDAVS